MRKLNLKTVFIKATFFEMVCTAGGLSDGPLIPISGIYILHNPPTLCVEGTLDLLLASRIWQRGGDFADVIKVS